MDCANKIGASSSSWGSVSRSIKDCLRTRSATDVVQSELSNLGVLLEKQGERLANAAGSTEDGNLGKLLPERLLAEARTNCTEGGSFSNGTAGTHVAGRGRESPALDSRGQHDELYEVSTRVCLVQRRSNGDESGQGGFGCEDDGGGKIGRR